MVPTANTLSPKPRGIGLGFCTTAESDDAIDGHGVTGGETLTVGGGGQIDREHRRPGNIRVGLDAEALTIRRTRTGGGREARKRVMVPSVLLPPGAVLTCQRTPKLEFCTVAENCTVPFTATFAADAETLTLAGRRGRGSELPAAPPQEACKSENSRAAAQAKPPRNRRCRREPQRLVIACLNRMAITFNYIPAGSAVISALAGCVYLYVDAYALTFIG